MTNYELVVWGENFMDLAGMRDFWVVRYVGYWVHRRDRGVRGENAEKSSAISFAFMAPKALGGESMRR